MGAARAVRGVRLLVVGLAALTAAGCSSSRLSSGSDPGWRAAERVMPRPSRNDYDSYQDEEVAPAPRAGDDNGGYVYRGGRDPATGRAPSTPRPTADREG